MAFNLELREFEPRGGGDPAADFAVQHAEVGRDIVAASYLRGSFIMASGEHSDFYFDKYLFETKPTILWRVADMLAEAIPSSVDRLVCNPGGGLALTAAVSLATGLPFVIVRSGDDEPPVRGELHIGERVVVILDVIDSGQQAIRSATRVVELGATVTGILGVVDREAGAKRAIEAAGYHYRPLYSLSELDV